jgi:DnaJ family protein C protein 13
LQQIALAPSNQSPGSPGADDRENFDVMFHMTEQDHSLPDLIWNSETRRELKDAIDNEMDQLRRASLEALGHRGEQDKPNGDGEYGLEGDAAQELRGVSWNFEEFEIEYRSLSQHICLGGCYLQLLLEDSADGLPSARIVSQIRDPARFFTTLYSCYLKSINANHVDLALMCLRVMIKVYGAHGRAIGLFEDTAYLLDSLTTCNSKSIRDAILELVSVLTSNKANTRQLVLRAEECLPSLFLLLQSSVHATADRMSPAAGPQPGAAVPEWYFRTKGDLDEQAKQGPVLISELRKLVQSNQLAPFS